MPLELYTYFRSSAAYRVRIALNLKGLDYTQKPINLVTGEQRSAEYLLINPSGLVPTLICEDGTPLSESLAICEYLEEKFPDPPILPAGSLARARVRALANLVACDIHPLNNLRVLNYLSGELCVEAEQKSAWYQHWITSGFSALESQLSGNSETEKFCHANKPSIADIALVPQVYNARRFNCSLNDYPTICRIAEACEKLTAFKLAHPDNQPDGIG